MQTIGIALCKLLDLISWLIVIQCLITWFPGGTQSKFYEVICNLTDPIVEPIRSIMYKYVNGPLDFSPMIAILLITFLRGIISSVFIF